MQYLNVAGYKFVTLDELPALRERLRARTAALELRGTILLAPEGINLFLAGETQKLESFLGELAGDARFADLPVKRSYSATQPFTRMLVRLKREIITMKEPDVRPAKRPAPRLAPKELKRWLDEGREVVLLDTRNEFEAELGTFKGALRLGLQSFSEFGAAVRPHAEVLREKTVVTFCTGGIRCEKAAPYLLERGFKDVYQLDGGILKYFEECGDAHYEGECFVFDKRVALDAQLREAPTAQCYACREVVTAEEQRSPKYVPGVSCPRCATAESALSSAP
jgi:UPF0176 protein